MAFYKPNEKITATFSHPSATTGISSWTTYLYKNGVAATPAITITEIGNGIYKMSVTPNETGIWDVYIEELGKTGTRVADRFVVLSSVDANITTNSGQTNTIPENLSFIIQSIQNLESVVKHLSFEISTSR